MDKTVPVPPEISSLVSAIVARAAPRAIWRFGSRARGDHRTDSDWDLAVSVDDAASPDLLDPMTYWTINKSLGVEATIVPAVISDIAACCGEPNTLGYDLAHEGLRLDAGR